LPLYNSEVSAPKVRGVTGSLFQLSVVLGQLLVSFITQFYRDWEFGMLLPGVAGVIIAMTVWLAPESPRHIMAKRGYEAGVAALKRVRVGNVVPEAEQIQVDIHAKDAADQINDMVSKKSFGKRIFIACWLQIAQQFTGFNALVSFSGTLFKQMGFSDPFMINLAFTAVQVVGLLVGIFLLDSIYGGRRSQLLGVSIVICPLFLLSGLAAAFSWSHAIKLTLVCLIGLIWQMAWGMIPWVYPSEIFTISERDRATSLAVFLQYGSNAVLMVVVPWLMTHVGAPGMFFFFAGFNVLNVIFVMTCIKETKGVPLEEIPALFGAKSESRKALVCSGSSALEENERV